MPRRYAIRVRSPGGGESPPATTGLLFAGNTNFVNDSSPPSPSPVLLWRGGFSTAPFNVPSTGATIIQEVIPTSTQKGYWIGFGWMQYTTTWDVSFSTTWKYVLTHPYPSAPWDWGSSNASHWEMSINGGDDIVASPISKYGVPHVQVTRITPSGGSISAEYMYDYGTNPSLKLGPTIDSKTNPSDPIFIVGDALWNALGGRGYEVYNGVIRGFRYYDAVLNNTQIDSELTTAGSVRTPWYYRLNPHAGSGGVDDQSGNDNHPAWLDATRPGTWEE